MSLKQRIFRLESQLKEKEIKMQYVKNEIDWEIHSAFLTCSEMEGDPRWTGSAELEIQNRALIGELERQRVERSNITHER